MTRKLIAFVTAGAIATAGLSVPAKADPADDLVRFLIGAAIIGAIASSVDNSNSRVTVTHGRHQPASRPYHPRRHHSHRHAHPPRQCLVRERTRRGWVERYAPRCMKRFGWHWKRGGWVKNRHAHR